MRICARSRTRRRQTMALWPDSATRTFLARRMPLGWLPSGRRGGCRDRSRAHIVGVPWDRPLAGVRRDGGGRPRRDARLLRGDRGRRGHPPRGPARHPRAALRRGPLLRSGPRTGTAVPRGAGPAPRRGRRQPAARRHRRSTRAAGRDRPRLRDRLLGDFPSPEGQAQEGRLGTDRAGCHGIAGLAGITSSSSHTCTSSPFSPFSGTGREGCPLPDRGRCSGWCSWGGRRSFRWPSSSGLPMPGWGRTPTWCGAS